MNNKLREEEVEKILNMYRSVQRNFKSRFEKVAKQYGFTSPQLAVIFQLHETPSITLNELSNHMRLTKSTVSGIVDRLTKQGVVIREIPKDNRRIVNLSISEEFKKNNDICAIKKRFSQELICGSINSSNSVDIEKIICGLEELNLLLKNSDD
ncbi:MarR family transcriptional regulator [Clostridium sp. A1-XYC3]|uniref:MarR family transcriptional regulator n=1 Tax=Clostridium tanneri TaxID=3037988 RepID=A0ABU4JXH8_9CLOT|nr:MarR family transcriptional regulator [Clostridium sp. A1-XYC3]MDW8802858.1 MarR family transcriptional regulator [Clostridium sp. A1-XYC3]